VVVGAQTNEDALVVTVIHVLANTALQKFSPLLQPELQLLRLQTLSLATAYQIDEIKTRTISLAAEWRLRCRQDRRQVGFTITGTLEHLGLLS
jgi:hypothetical protein